MDEYRRILHLDFDQIERSRSGCLVTDGHKETSDASRKHNIESTQQFAQINTRQQHDIF